MGYIYTLISMVNEQQNQYKKRNLWAEFNLERVMIHCLREKKIKANVLFHVNELLQLYDLYSLLARDGQRMIIKYFPLCPDRTLFTYYKKYHCQPFLSKTYQERYTNSLGKPMPCYFHLLIGNVSFSLVSNLNLSAATYTFIFLFCWQQRKQMHYHLHNDVL